MHLDPKQLQLLRIVARGFIFMLAVVYGWLKTGSEAATLSGHVLCTVGGATVLTGVLILASWSFRRA